MAGSLEYTKLDEKSDFFTFLFIAFVHMWFAISGIDQSWNLTILRSGALLPLKTVCQLDPCSLIGILDMGALLSPLKIQVFKVFELFSCGEKHPYKLQFKQSSLISGKGEVVGIMKMATW